MWRPWNDARRCDNETARVAEELLASSGSTPFGNRPRVNDDAEEVDDPADVARGTVVERSRRRRRRGNRAWRTAVAALVALCWHSQGTSTGAGLASVGPSAADMCILQHATLRVGEASGPGPGETTLHWTTEDVHGPAYSRPGKPGFHGAHTAGHRNAMSPPPTEAFALSTVTVNSTGWGPLRNFLLKTEAHLVFGQEHRLPQSAIPAASSWARRHGWKSVWAPAIPGPGGGWSAGTVVLARSYLGLRHPAVGDRVVVPGRVAAAVLEAPSCRPIVAYSAYLRHGQQLGRENLDTLAEIGNHWEAQGDPNLLYMVAADFNMKPEVLQRARLAERIKGRLVFPSSWRGTCRTRTSAATYDYFLVSNPLAEIVDVVTTVEGSGIKTHTPTSLTFHPRQTALKALGIRAPPAIPLEPVVGPRLPPPDYGALLDAADDLCRFARDGGDETAAKRRLNDIFGNWANLAEDELCDVTGHVLSKWGCRGAGPRMAWRSIVPERSKGCGGEAGADALAWAADIVRDASRLVRRAGVFGDGDDDGEGALDDDGTPTLFDLLVDELATGQPMGKADIVGDGTVDLVKSILGEARDLGSDGVPAAHPRSVAWHARVDLTLSDLQRRHAAAVAADKRDKAEAWREWIREGFQNGARNAHAFTRLPNEWQPSVEVTAAGAVTADPAAVLEGQREKYKRLWSATDQRGRYRWREREALPRLSPEELRSSSKLFRRRTAVTHDGFHMRHFALLSDQALATLAAVLEACERLGAFPEQCNLVVTPLLEKPRGGYRPIAIYCSLYRLYTKARRSVAAEWEARHRRPFFSAAAGNGPLDTAWRQAVRQEASLTRGGAAASLLWDLEAFYERVNREVLLKRADASGFPLPVLRLSLAAYSAPRVLALDGRIARELTAREGVGAGCGLACTYVKIYVLEPMDRLMHRLPPSVSMDLHVDDYALSCEAESEEQVARDLAAAQGLLKEVIECELGATISVPKAALVASSMRLAKAIGAAVGELAGPIRKAAPNLGTDATAGKRRRAVGTATLGRARLAAAWKRRHRLRQVGQVVGRKAVRIFVAGIGPSGTYHAAVAGLSDSEALKIRRVAAAAMPPRSRFRSLTMTHIINDMPTLRAETAASLQYARAVWAAVVAGAAKPRFPGFDLPGLRAAWEGVLDKAAEFIDQDAQDPARRRKWGAIRGPIAATILELDRLGWRCTGPFEWVDDQGVSVCLTTTPPALLKDMFHASMRRQAEWKMGKAWAARDDTFVGKRLCVDAALHALARDRSLTPKQKGAYISVLTGAVLTMNKAANGGYDVPDICPLCGECGDTVYHRCYSCRATRDAVRAAVPAWFWAETQKAPEARAFWTTGAVPHPADMVPRPRDDYLPWAVDGSGNREDEAQLAGNIFIDGSCSTSIFRGLQRASFSMVQVDDAAEPVRTLSTPMWSSLPQTSQAAEYAAYAGLAQVLGGGSTVYGDSLGVLQHAAKQGPERLDGRRKYSGVLLSMNRHPEGLRRIEAAVKVKAHQNLSAISDPHQLWMAKGNDHADRAAKLARERHPQPSHEVQTQIRYWTRRIPHIVRAVATAMAEFPPAGGSLPRKPRPRAAAVAGTAARPDAHRWTFVEGRWRCSNCWTYILGQSIPAARRTERCDAARVGKALRHFESRGHTMLHAEGALPVAFCLRCGGWSSRRAHRLARQCGPPTASGREALRRIAAGQHPWRARSKTTGKEQPRGGLTAAAAWRGGDEGWIRRGSTATRASWGTSRGRRTDAGAVGGGDVACVAPAAAALQCDEATCTAVPVDDFDTEDHDVFGHGGMLDEPTTEAARADKGPEAVDARVASALAAVDQWGFDPRIRGASVDHLVAVMQDSMAVKTRGREDPYGKGNWMVFNCAMGTFVTARIDAIEAELIWLRSELAQKPLDEGRRHDDEDQSNKRKGMDDAAEAPRAKAARAPDMEEDDTGLTREATQRCLTGQRQDLQFHRRRDLLAALSREDAHRRGLTGRSEGGRGSGKHSLVAPTGLAAGKRRRLESLGAPSSLAADAPFDCMRDGVGDNEGHGGGVWANDAAGNSVVAAREGPRGSESTGSTAVTVARSPRADVAAVAVEAEVTILQPLVDALPARAGGGEVTNSPADGRAAPSERDSGVVASRLHGREFDVSPQAKPSATCGEGPPNGHVVHSPLDSPPSLGAGPSDIGRTWCDEEGDPTPGVARRRVGSDNPAALASVTRCSAALTAQGGREQPQRGWARHNGAARKNESAMQHDHRESYEDGDDLDPVLAAPARHVCDADAMSAEPETVQTAAAATAAPDLTMPSVALGVSSTSSSRSCASRSGVAPGGAAGAEVPWTTRREQVLALRVPPARLRVGADGDHPALPPLPRGVDGDHQRPVGGAGGPGGALPGLLPRARELPLPCHAPHRPQRGPGALRPRPPAGVDEVHEHAHLAGGAEHLRHVRRRLDRAGDDDGGHSTAAALFLPSGVPSGATSQLGHSAENDGGVSTRSCLLEFPRRSEDRGGCSGGGAVITQTKVDANCGYPSSDVGRAHRRPCVQPGRDRSGGEQRAPGATVDASPPQSLSPARKGGTSCTERPQPPSANGPGTGAILTRAQLLAQLRSTSSGTSGIIAAAAQPAATARDVASRSQVKTEKCTSSRRCSPSSSASGAPHTAGASSVGDALLRAAAAHYRDEK